MAQEHPKDLQTNLLLSYGLDLGHGRGRDHESTNDDPGPSSLNPTKLSLNERFRIYFPSHNTVKNSRGGQNVSQFLFISAPPRLRISHANP